MQYFTTEGGTRSHDRVVLHRSLLLKSATYPSIPCSPLLMLLLLCLALTLNDRMDVVKDDCNDRDFKCHPR